MRRSALDNAISLRGRGRTLWKSSLPRVNEVTTTRRSGEPDRRGRGSWSRHEAVQQQHSKCTRAEAPQRSKLRTVFEESPSSPIESVTVTPENHSPLDGKGNKIELFLDSIFFKGEIGEGAHFETKSIEFVHVPGGEGTDV